MRNDLNGLQIRCINAGQGCEVVSSLENLHIHEDECEFAFMSCSNTGMKLHIGRKDAPLIGCLCYLSSIYDQICSILPHLKSFFDGICDAKLDKPMDADHTKAI